MPLQKHLEQFAKNTSMHGCGKIILTKKPEKRMAWTIVFTAAWVLFAYHLYNVLVSYLKFSIKTTNEFIPGGAPFPSITICNMQSLDFYTLHVLYLATLSFNWLAENESLAEYVGRNNSLAYEISKVDDLLRKHWSNLTVEDLYKLASRTTISANLDQEILENGLAKQDEFIVKCTYGNSKCHFKVINHPYYFKCFTFEPSNLKNDTDGEYDSLSEGIENGFSVTLFTGTKLMNTSGFSNIIITGLFQRGSPLSGSAGIRMVIHPPGTEPFPLSEGYDIPTGYQASLGIVPRRHKRLGKPYGKCTDKNKYLEQRNFTKHEEHQHYRKISCERTCMQQHVLKECKCLETSLPSTGDTLCEEGTDSGTENLEELNPLSCGSGKSNVSLCRQLREVEGNHSGFAEVLKNIRCAEEVTKRFMTDVKELATCGCFSPCNEFRYDVSYSLSRWPSLGYEAGAVFTEIFYDDSFLTRFSEEKRTLYKEYVNKEGVFALKDFAKINVYVTDSNIMTTTEEPGTTIDQLLSDIGGQLGIWVGVSIITISEVLETMLTIITAAFKRVYRRHTKTSDVEEKGDLDIGQPVTQKS